MKKHIHHFDNLIYSGLAELPKGNIEEGKKKGLYIDVRICRCGKETEILWPMARVSAYKKRQGIE